MHGDFQHLANNALELWLIGRPLERMIGSRAMALLLLLGIVAGALVAILTGADVPIVGASGAGFAVAGAGVVAAIRGWAALRWGTRLRLLALVWILLAQAPLLLLGEVDIELPLGIAVFTLHLEPSPSILVVHLVHGVAFVVGLVVALALLAPGPWLGRARRPRALAATAAVLLTAALALAFFLRARPTWSPADVTRCQDSAVGCEQLVALFREACDDGSAVGCHNVAYMLDEGGQMRIPMAAIPFYRRGCDGGYVASCLNLTILLRSDRVPADPPLARRAAGAACKGGLLLACHHLGVDQAEGQGGPRDEAAARVTLRSACEGGLPMACNDLGALLWNGRGGAEDRDQARVLIERACATGQAPHACENAQKTRAPADPPR